MRPLHPKVKAGGIAGAAAVVVVFALGQRGVKVPADVSDALTVLLAGFFAWLKKA